MNQCKICNSTQEHPILVAREMMFGFRDEFLYFQCVACGCLQIAEIPENMSRYYPDDYYSFKQVPIGIFKKIAMYFLANAYMLGLTVLRHGPYLKFPSRTSVLGVLKHCSKKDAILDVGSGAGNFLLEMKNWGFSNLTGIDPYIEKDIFYPSGVKVLRQTTHEHEGKYDIIMLNHSFEHMSEPHAVFKDLARLLNDSGILLIRVPVSDSFAFRKYRNNWFQLDAPRHFFLHTTRSMSYLAKNNGFLIEDVIYDSIEAQILESEGYCRDIPLLATKKNTSSFIKKCRKFAKHLNEMKDGDQCCFILKRVVSS
ncbi:MAG: class I SAM-dependent methyltransferase [Zoogloeaceae bacterium]|jgi:SAM-dependent methyltransferase|nr:class I SAM-dependent methyltransferase [Zoogloeaceae bacterium]